MQWRTGETNPENRMAGLTAMKVARSARFGLDTLPVAPTGIDPAYMDSPWPRFQKTRTLAPALRPSSLDGTLRSRLPSKIVCLVIFTSAVPLCFQPLIYLPFQVAKRYPSIRSIYIRIQKQSWLNKRRKEQSRNSQTITTFQTFLGIYLLILQCCQSDYYYFDNGWAESNYNFDQSIDVFTLWPE